MALPRCWLKTLNFKRWNVWRTFISPSSLFEIVMIFPQQWSNLKCSVNSIGNVALVIGKWHEIVLISAPVKWIQTSKMNSVRRHASLCLKTVSFATWIFKFDLSRYWAPCCSALGNIETLLQNPQNCYQEKSSWRNYLPQRPCFGKQPGARAELHIQFFLPLECSYFIHWREISPGCRSEPGLLSLW